VRVATVWVCLGSPCGGAFLPCYLEGTVPDVLARAGRRPTREARGGRCGRSCRSSSATSPASGR
jgi:hypothetical protein